MINIIYFSVLNILKDYSKQIKPKAVGNLLDDYYNEVMRLDMMKEGDKRFNYNAMGNKILDIIEELTGSRDPLFTWLSNEEKSHFILIESVPGFSSTIKRHILN